ncbi:protein kinase [bacterium]|nr:protein kinase [bacterium]
MNIDLKNGDLFYDRYLIIETIATSANSRAYHARDQKIGREITLKIFVLDESWDEQAKEQYIKELTIAAKLSHPNIATLYNTEITGSICFITSEYVDGYSLRTILKTKPVIRPEVSSEIVYLTCLALEHAHQNGVVHRHVQPDSIIVTKQGGLKLSDFGVRSYLYYQSSQSLVNSAEPSLFAYSAPEILHGHSVNYLSDQYALGITSYEMLCGRRPYLASTYESFSDEIQRFVFPPPHKLNPNIPVDFERIILKCFSQYPEQRYKNSTELRDELEALCKNGSIEAFLNEFQKMDDEISRLSRAETFELQKEERVVFVQRDSNEQSGAKIEETIQIPLESQESSSRPKKVFPKWAYALLAGLFLVMCASVFYVVYSRNLVKNYLEKADQLFAQGDQITLTEDGAFHFYQKALDIDEGNDHARSRIETIQSELWLKLDTALKTDSLSDARTTYDLLKKADPGNPKLKQSGEILIRKEEVFRLSEQKKNEAKRVLQDVDQLMTEKEYDAAVEVCQKALGISPHLPEAMMKLAELYLAQNKIDEALATLREINLWHPDHVESRIELATIYRKQGDYGKAEQELRQAIVQFPQAQYLHFHLASVLQLQQRYKEAVEEYRRELELNEFSIAHFNLGYLLQLLNDNDAAILNYRKAIELKPDMRQGYFNLGYLLYKRDRLEEAIDILEKASTLFPDYYKVQELLKEVKDAQAKNQTD